MTDIDQQVAALIRPEIQALQAYQVGNAEGMVKLDAMENPYSWPQDLVNKWQDALSTAQLNRYPHPNAPEVTLKLKERMSIPEQYEVLLGNGSDEIIQLLAMALAKPGASILAPEPGFVMYKMIATYIGMDYLGVPLNEDFSLNMKAMLDQIEIHQPALVFLAQPNNPTGNLWNESDLRSIIQASKGLVVIDEAYLPFSERDHLGWLDEFDNLVVMRTLSKVGLAGLRLGMLIGRPEWLHELNKVRMPYNINVLTQVSTAFALEHFDLLESQCHKIKLERANMQVQLNELGFYTYPSQANFVLAKPHKLAARSIFESLKEKGILIKCLDGAHPLLANALRFTVGSEDENLKLYKALQEINEAL